MTLLSEPCQDALFDSNRYQEGENNDDMSSSVDTSPKEDQGSISHESGTNSKSESNRTGATDDEVNMIKEELARAETKQVFRLRILVILILVTVAIALTVTIYHITLKAEIEAFEIEFEGVAEAIITSLNGTYSDTLVAQDIRLKKVVGSRLSTDLSHFLSYNFSHFLSSTFLRYLRSYGCGCWSRRNVIGRR